MRLRCDPRSPSTEGSIILIEEFITPENFAKIFCADLELPHFPYVDQVAGAIRAQLEEHGVVASFELEQESSESEVEAEEAEDVSDAGAEPENSPASRRKHRNGARKRKDRVSTLRRSKSRTGTPDQRAQSEVQLDEEEQEPEVDEKVQMDARVLLALDVQINKHHLLDTIEWDLAPVQLANSQPLPPHLIYPSASSESPLQSSIQDLNAESIVGAPIPGSSDLPSTPEALARILCADIGLHGEAVPLVAHALHEEILKHKKDAIEWGVLAVEPLSARARARNPFGPGPKPLRGVWRDWIEVPEFTPRLEIMSQEEMERRELERERIARYVFHICFISFKSRFSSLTHTFISSDDCAAIHRNMSRLLVVAEGSGEHVWDPGFIVFTWGLQLYLYCLHR